MPGPEHDLHALCIRPADPEDLAAWTCLRSELWPGEAPAQLQDEARRVLDHADEICLLLCDARGAALGFLEGRIHDGPPPYGHVEGWYVRPSCRGRGHGARLMGAFEQWCLHRAIPRLTSDTCDDYPLSPAAHGRAGFREIATMRIFLKELGPGARRDAGPHSG